MGSQGGLRFQIVTDLINYAGVSQEGPSFEILFGLLNCRRVGVSGRSQIPWTWVISTFFTLRTNIRSMLIFNPNHPPDEKPPLDYSITLIEYWARSKCMHVVIRVADPGDFRGSDPDLVFLHGRIRVYIEKNVTYEFFCIHLRRG